jgi:hypothetical protein
MFSVANKPIMLSVVMLTVFMLSFVAPFVCVCACALERERERERESESESEIE